jgi:hypothetical protein
MSMSFHTKAKIPRSFFPAIGKTALLEGKPVKAMNYSDEKNKDATSFILRDQNGFEMGLYFSSKDEAMLLDFFDFTVGNWSVLDGADQDGTWMRKAVMRARRRGIKQLPPGPDRMPRKQEARLKGTAKAFYDIKGLAKPDDDGFIYLPTRSLTCTVEEFKAALERHGLIVTQVEGRKAFKVRSAPGTTLTMDWNGPGSNFYDRYDWIEFKEHPDQPPTSLLELRILPYIETGDRWGGWMALCIERPVLPTDDLKRIRTRAWPLLESMSAEDESPVVKEIRAEKAEELRIANLDVENAELRRENARLQALLTPGV